MKSQWSHIRKFNLATHQREAKQGTDIIVKFMPSTAMDDPGKGQSGHYLEHFKQFCSIALYLLGFHWKSLDFNGCQVCKDAGRRKPRVNEAIIFTSSHATTAQPLPVIVCNTPVRTQPQNTHTHTHTYTHTKQSKSPVGTALLAIIKTRDSQVVIKVHV